MSGGEPSSIKRFATVRRRSACPSVCPRDMRAFCFGVRSLSGIWEGRCADLVPGALPQVAAAGPLPTCYGQDQVTAALKNELEHRPAGPRLSVHRLPGHRQDHLRQDLWPRRSTACTRRRATPAANARSAGASTAGSHPGCGRDRRRLQQRRGQHPGSAGGGGLHPFRCEIPGLYHRRGAHALRTAPSTPC